MQHGCAALEASPKSVAAVGHTRVADVDGLTFILRFVPCNR
jgi:hypothetical protein